MRAVNPLAAPTSHVSHRASRVLHRAAIAPTSISIRIRQDR
ncbi:MAG: hypothetical protein ABW190_11190 [Rhizobacter sp.]